MKKQNILLALIKGAAKTLATGGLALGLAFFEATGIQEHMDSERKIIEEYLDQTKIYQLDSQEQILAELSDAGFNTTFYKRNIKAIVKDLKNRDYRLEKINLKK